MGPRDSAQGGTSQEPENKEAADNATQDNDLSTGHKESGDGGDDNAKS